MPLRQRFGVAILFALGMVVTIAGVVRTWYIYKSFFLEDDTTWYAYPLWIAAAVEIDLGVVSQTNTNTTYSSRAGLTYTKQICASAPVLRPLLAKIPFSLSGSFSHGISLGYNNSTENSTAAYKSCLKKSKLSSNTPIIGSRSVPLAPIPSASREPGPIRSAQESSQNRDKSYEMGTWNSCDDVELGTISHMHELESIELDCSSREHILETEPDHSSREHILEIDDEPPSEDTVINAWPCGKDTTEHEPRREYDDYMNGPGRAE